MSTLAVLELTEAPNGDLLERLLVTNEKEAVSNRLGSTTGQSARLRVFAQIASELTGVPSSVRARLDQAALVGFSTTLAQSRSGKSRGISHIPSATFTVLRHHDQLQVLQSESLAESLDVWQRNAGAEDVLIEFSEPLVRTSIAGREQNRERFYEHLRSVLSARVQPRSVGPAPPRPTAVGHDEYAGRTSAAQRVLDDAAAQRKALASQWLTAAQVSADWGSQATNVSHRASQLRRDGKLLGVYVTDPAPSYRYPTWQFFRPGEPVYVLPEILRVLREYGPFERESEGLRRTTGWGEVEWFLTPHALLDGATPADMLATDPDRVLQAVRTEFEDQI
ncbi:hypothetical protein [Stenotrophomonas maltophilia]|uniref:hypothetical protein n=1 Tax=Stenotrophomonas maltophilia TaxID=40324 RepID=UPI0039C08FEF